MREKERERESSSAINYNLDYLIESVFISKCSDRYQILKFCGDFVKAKKNLYRCKA